MNVDKKISRTSKKSQEAILLAGEKLLLSGNVNLINAENLSKQSGYSIGNIYHHFKSLDQVFIKIFLKKRLDIFLGLVDEINKFPKYKSCEELCKILVNKSFERANKLKIKVLQYIFKIMLTRSEEPEKINLIIDVLIEPLIECRKRNKTNSFREIEEDEMRLLLRSLQAFIRSPFLENQSIAGTALHKELTLNLCQKLFSIK
ncbi:TetR/AcrR family transcriptional regulator [Candidatus Methylopumilus universalis]|uniref:TetR/AcrR family transcriptional regulator n=1 Tax=Candidatus Methylopumilus universalis TaxID=2588536 RepID=A0ABX5VRS1_9PROT|nr:TetR/AcrR family transcriptional regulator [Candidatus Methylopumilus universalis]QDC60637.1 TetR/AcrR family transcriptional regulator [Candidatus Methylopumilus universalis]